uniref:Uncharacterized protein n=1 Tax=Oryza brachyantha TaxID=4533 RepID=J3MFM1_ORYBR
MESHRLLSHSILLREADHLCGAGAGADGRVLPVVVRFPRWTAAGLGAARLTAARPPAAGLPEQGPWVQRNDDETKVNVWKVICWSSSEALEFIKQTPPPAVGVHDVEKLKKTFEDLMQSAETESVEAYYATHMLLLNHWHLWETYSLEPVKGYNGPRLFLRDCVKFACGADGYVLYDYLNTFGLTFDSMPKDNMDRDLIAAILYVSKDTREYVGQYRKRLAALHMRRYWEADEKEKERGGRGGGSQAQRRRRHYWGLSRTWGRRHLGSYPLMVAFSDPSYHVCISSRCSALS